MSRLIFRHDRAGYAGTLLVTVRSEGSHGALGAAGLGPASYPQEWELDALGNLPGTAQMAGVAPGTGPVPPLHRLTVYQGTRPISSVTFEPVETEPGIVNVLTLIQAGQAQVAAPEQLVQLAELLDDGKAQLQQIGQVLTEAAQATTEALAVSGINPAYISETTADPPAAPDGTLGARRGADGAIQRLERVAGAWVARGAPLGRSHLLTGDTASRPAVSTEGVHYLDVQSGRLWNWTLGAWLLLGSLTLASCGQTEPSLVAIGDSITRGWGLDSPDEAWPAIVGQMKGWTVVNAGVDSSTLGAPGYLPMAERWQSVVPAGYKGHVALMGGTNDYNTNVPLGAPGDTLPGTIYGALFSIGHGVLNRSDDVYLHMLSPIWHYQENTRNTAGYTMAQVRQAVADVAAYLAQRYPGRVEFIDVGKATLETLGAPNNVYMIDGLHPNKRGAAWLGRFIGSYITTGAEGAVTLPQNPVNAGAGHFDGAGHLEIGGAAELRNAQATYEAWVRTPTPAAFQVILAHGDAVAGECISLNLDNTGKVRAQIARDNWASFVEFTSPAAVQANTWTHVALTTQPGEHRLYVNGQQVAQSSSATGASGVRADAGPLCLGAIKYGADYAGRLIGDLDEVRVWTSARTPAQIAGNYLLRLTSAPELVASMTMDEPRIIAGPLGLGAFGGYAVPVGSAVTKTTASPATP